MDVQSDELGRYGVRLPVTADHPEAAAVELSYSVLDTAPIGMALLDRGGAFHWVNEALARLTGCSAEALLATHSQAVIVDDDWLGGSLDGLLADTEAGEAPEVRWQRADGAQRWVSLHASVATAPDGQPLELGPDRRTAMILQVLDITDRKLVEEALDVAHHELTERNAELVRSNEELAEFAYVASHDISEPLRVISGHVKLLADRYGDALDDDAHRWIEFAVDGCERMRALIDDLLVYSRAGRAARPHEPLDLGEVVDQARRDLAVAMEEAGGQVEVGPMPTVVGDARQLRQVIANLVGNALKFRDPDRPAEVRISADRHGETWVVRVVDNGIGIAERHRDRVFKLFQRLHHREAYPGTGLGLAIARKVVTSHGGRIWVEDGTDGGTAVCVALPDPEARDGDSAAHPPDLAGDAAGGNR